MVYSYFDGEFWNRNFTFIAANDNSNVKVANGRASVGGDGVTNIIATRVVSGSTPTSQTNTVATLNNGGGSSAKLTYTRQLAPRFEYKLGSWVIDGGGAVFERIVRHELRPQVRPAAERLAPERAGRVFAIDENAQRISIPNRALLPEYHKKFQTRFAYYFSGRSPGSLSLAFSQVNSMNFVQTYDFTAADYGIDDPDFDGYTVRSKANVNGTRRFRNMSFSYRQTLGFLPSEYLRGINVSFTYDRSYADLRRSGLAPHRITSRLGYSHRRFNGTLGMVWVDDKPQSGTYGRYFGEITKFDLTLSWKLTRYATLYVQGRNITNMRDRWYQTPPGSAEGENGYLRALEEYGANWVFGVKGSF